MSGRALARGGGDTGAVESALSKFVFEQAGAESLRSFSIDDTASFVDLDGNSLDASAPIIQTISSKWPEKLITSKGATGDSLYRDEFPTASSPSNGSVTQVTVLDSARQAIAEDRLLSDFTAIDFGVLTGETNEDDDRRSSNFLNKKPAGSDTKSGGDRFHNFLWLLERGTIGNSGGSGSRMVKVFKLENIEESKESQSGQSTVKLIYGALTPNTAATNGEPTLAPPPTATPTNAPTPTATPIPAAPVPSGLVSWWDGDGSGTTAQDIQDGNPGTLVGNTARVAGYVGQAFSFDGGGDYVEVADSPSLDPTEITIETWVKIASAPTTNGNIVAKGDNSGYRFRIDNLRSVSFFDRGCQNCLQSNGLVPLGQWTHIAVVGSTSGLRIYLNGALDYQSVQRGPEGQHCAANLVRISGSHCDYSCSVPIWRC